MRAMVVAVLLLAVGCKDADVVAENRAKAEARLEEMRAAIVEARENRAINYKAREPLTLTGDRPNAALVEASWFVLVDGGVKHELVSRAGDIVEIKGALLRGQNINGGPREHEAIFERFYRLEYLVVIDLTLFEGVQSDDGSIVGGTANGYVHIVDIKAKKSLAGIPIAAKSSDAVTVPEADNPRGDVKVRARAAVNDALTVWLAVGEKPPL